MVILGSAAAAQLMVLALGLALALVLWRHQSPVPLRRGMSEAEVQDLFGTPTQTTVTERRADWTYTESSAETVISFRSGRVQRVRFQ